MNLLESIDVFAENYENLSNQEIPLAIEDPWLKIYLCLLKASSVEKMI